MCWEVWEMKNIIETWTLTQGRSSPSGECEWCLQQPGPGFFDLQLYCLQDIFRSTQPRLLLWYWYLILLCHQDFKLWNSVRPQTLIFLSFSYLLIFSLPSSWTPDPLNAHTRVFRYEYSALSWFHLPLPSLDTVDIWSDQGPPGGSRVSTKLSTNLGTKSGMVIVIYNGSLKFEGEVELNKG